MARTPMARLPWLTRTRFLVPMKFFQKLKKTKKNLFYREIVCCVYSLESPHRLILVENRKDFPKLSLLLPKLVP